MTLKRFTYRDMRLGDLLIRDVKDEPEKHCLILKVCQREYKDDRTQRTVYYSEAKCLTKGKIEWRVFNETNLHYFDWWILHLDNLEEPAIVT